jgi:hypothetical protein
MPTRCWLPSDSASILAWPWSARPRRSLQLRAAARACAAVSPCRRDRYSSCSSTLIDGYRPRSSGM